MAATPLDWHGERWAEITETPTAVLLFTGDRAWKLKKPVCLGFLDFGTPEARAQACAREVELNRRFAPEDYLGTAEVQGPDGEICEHLVVMRRMPAARRLSTLVAAHAPVAGTLRQVARILAAQHTGSARGPQISAQGTRDALRERWADNVLQARQWTGERMPPGPLDPAMIEETEELACRFLAGRGPLFDARIRDGRIIDGHGDLLADDIFCLDDGPRILDCLDFDDKLRWLDGLDDAAFLAMDLERLGAPAWAEQFLASYAEYSGDPAPASLRHHYIAYRAFVRAKVACLRDDPAGPHDARHLAEISVRHLREGAVTLVLAGGLPGSDRSAVAGKVADRLGYAVLNSDRIRKELAGLPAETSARASYGSGIYTPEWTERVYQELLHRATVLLSRGESVVADASFTTAWQRTAAATAAATVSADLVQLRCTAPWELAAGRLYSRSGGTADADQEIAVEMEAAADPWPDAIVIDTEDDTAGLHVESVQRALRAIHPDGPPAAARSPRSYMCPG
ncbi:MAG TPA: AAA family ATPase [Trebonia sp.]|nr:AAA family ATPase [Trebonia sp.]